jgi:hypothetical protein
LFRNERYDKHVKFLGQTKIHVLLYLYLIVLSTDKGQCLGELIPYCKDNEGYINCKVEEVDTKKIVLQVSKYHLKE